MNEYSTSKIYIPTHCEKRKNQKVFSNTEIFRIDSYFLVSKRVYVAIKIPPFVFFSIGRSQYNFFQLSRNIEKIFDRPHLAMKQQRSTFIHSFYPANYIKIIDSCSVQALFLAFQNRIGLYALILVFFIKFGLHAVILVLHNKVGLQIIVLMFQNNMRLKASILAVVIKIGLNAFILVFHNIVGLHA